MGHWAESLADEVEQRVGGTIDGHLLREVLGAAGHEIEVLSGRTFQPARRATSVFEPNGLPLVDVPDLHVDSTESQRDVWEIPDPVNPAHATVLHTPSLGTSCEKGCAYR